jgi:hypothetical protein
MASVALYSASDKFFVYFVVAVILRTYRFSNAGNEDLDSVCIVGLPN